jgi:hypothetical protein
LADPKFVDEQERVLFARAVLGEKARQFLMTDVGRYLHARANADVAQAQVESIKCNIDFPWGRRRLRKLQLQAATAENFIKWLADAIVDGDHAETELAGYRDEE